MEHAELSSSVIFVCHVNFSRRLEAESAAISVLLNWLRNFFFNNWFYFIFFRFQYVVLPEQEALKEKVETDLLSEGRYEAKN